MEHKVFMKRAAVILSMVVGSSLLALESPYPLTENTFDNPEFVKRFMGSYGFDMLINPDISSEEAELFKTIAPSMERNPRAAVSQIRAFISQKQAEGEQHSAALDYTIASLLLQSGDLQGAVGEYEIAIRKFPNFYRAYQNLGLAFIQAQQPARALPHLIKALEIGGGNGGLYGLMGYAYLSTGKPEIALEAYRSALMYQPDSRDWQNGKLSALLSIGKSEDVVAFVEDLLKDKPRDSNLWTQQANAFLSLRKYDDAIANLEVIRRMGQGSANSMVLLGDLYLSEGLADDAVAAYREATSKGSLSFSKQLQLAEGLLVRGSADQAGQILDGLSAMKDRATPDELIEFLTMQAKVSLGRGDTETAFALLQQVVEQDPLNGEAQIALGDFYRENGDLEEAKYAYEAAVKVDAVKWKGLIALARVSVAERNYPQAIAYLKRAKAIDEQSFINDYINQLEKALGRI
jgi:tetratricopeptide (TPR) repeat protein